MTIYTSSGSHDHEIQQPFILKNDNAAEHTVKKNVFDQQPGQDSGRADTGLGARIGFEAQLGDELEPSIQLPDSEKSIAIGLGT